MATAVLERAAKSAPTLADALAQLRALTENLARREKFVYDALSLLSERLQSYRQADVTLGLAVAGGRIDDVRAALEGLERAPNCSAIVEQHLAGLNHSRKMRLPREAFFRDHPEAQQVLATVCSLRLEQARDSLKQITANEQRHLDSLGEFDATASPVVKHASAKVGRLAGMLKRIDNDLDLGTFFDNFAQQLWQDER